jgi:hypothetical protein
MIMMWEKMDGVFQNLLAQNKLFLGIQINNKILWLYSISGYNIHDAAIELGPGCLQERYIKQALHVCD